MAVAEVGEAALPKVPALKEAVGVDENRVVRRWTAPAIERLKGPR